MSSEATRAAQRTSSTRATRSGRPVLATSARARANSTASIFESPRRPSLGSPLQTALGPHLPIGRRGCRRTSRQRSNQHAGKDVTQAERSPSNPNANRAERREEAPTTREAPTGTGFAGPPALPPWGGDDEVGAGGSHGSSISDSRENGHLRFRSFTSESTLRRLASTSARKRRQIGGGLAGVAGNALRLHQQTVHLLQTALRIAQAPRSAAAPWRARRSPGRPCAAEPSPLAPNTCLSALATRPSSRFAQLVRPG